MIKDTISEWLAGYRRNRKKWYFSNFVLAILTSPIAPPKMEAPQYAQCAKYPFIKHILLSCDNFRQTHQKYYQTSNLKDLFKNTKPEDNLSFLKNQLFHPNLTKSNFSLKSDQIWSNTIIKTHTLNPKKPTQKTKTNLTFLALNDPLRLVCH